jgi:outer membrane protein assembly factor BamA
MRVFIPIIKTYHSTGILLFFFLLILNLNSIAGLYPPNNPKDTTGFLVIHSIKIKGNLQTRPSIILRELEFHESDTIGRTFFQPMLKAGRENIFNTALFNFVTIDTIPLGGSPLNMDVIIHVVERWYIWPWPYFEISDRNFNSWLETTDLSRLTYGIDLTIRNITGMNETLKFPIHFGFNQKLGFSYQIPYINYRKTVGIGFGMEYNWNHEVIVEAVDNKPVYYKNTDYFPRKNLYAFTEILLRPTFYARHTFRLSFNAWSFSDSLLNVPGYTTGTSNHLNYFSIYYQYKNDHRDIQYYPLKGTYFDVELDQNGLFSSSVNEFFLKSNFRRYFHIHNRWYFASGLTGKLTLTPQPPYFMQRGLGYGREFVRGYEYYVIDGKDFILWKNNFKFALIPPHEFNIDFIHSSKFNRVPFALYLNVFCDMGYVNWDALPDDQSNTLRNSLLVGYGIGLDLTTYYDIVIRLELSMNAEGTPGIYLHFIAPI